MIALTMALALATGAAVAEAPESAKQPMGDLAPGRVLAFDNGSFTDPATLPGLTFGAQGGLGVERDTGTFGYDGLAGQLRWTPGSNSVGRRLSILTGFANWYSPAAEDLYETNVLPTETASLPASTETAAVVGASLALGERASVGFSDKIEGEYSKRYAEKKPELGQLDVEQASASSQIEQDSIAKKRAAIMEYVNAPYYSRSYRPSLAIGGMLRLEELAPSTLVDAIDMFSGGAWTLLRCG